MLFPACLQKRRPFSWGRWPPRSLLGKGLFGEKSETLGEPFRGEIDSPQELAVVAGLVSSSQRGVEPSPTGGRWSAVVTPCLSPDRRFTRLPPPQSGSVGAASPRRGTCVASRFQLRLGLLRRGRSAASWAELQLCSSPGQGWTQPRSG